MQIKSIKLFGSRLWGGSTDESDYDYIIRISEFNKSEKLKDLEKTYEYIDNNLFNKFAVKYNYNGKIINIVAYDDEYYDIAVKAIDKVTAISQVIDLSSKRLRHRICETIFDFEFKDIKKEISDDIESIF